VLRTNALLRAKLAETRRFLAESEEGFRALVESSSLGVLVHAGGRVLSANDVLCRMLGREPGSLAGSALDRLIPAEDMARFLSLGVKAGPEGSPEADFARTRGEYRMLCADGALCANGVLCANGALRADGALWVEAAGAAVTRAGVEAVQVVACDLSSRRDAECRRRELEELARRQEEQLEHSTRLAELGGMAAAISRELNQPLTGIRNYARNAFYMIDKGLGGEEEAKGNLRLISEQVDRAAKIINQMRDLTRRADRTSAGVDINGVVRESMEFLLPQMRLSEVEVTLALAPDLPPVWGDRIRLAQVFLNLLTNARQAMDCAPERRLSIASRRDPLADRPVVIEVTDTGRGFSEEIARSLFQPFYTTRKGGHGLGLSISRAIVQDHGGTIEASGRPGGGASFTIRLPAELGGSGRSP
jgi:C4-dicarboxylate-specific signal transduction histidine kinase